MFSSLLAISLLAAPSPLGVMIRPTFFKNLVQSFNTRPKPVTINLCWKNLSVTGDLKLKMSEPQFQANQGADVFISTTIESYEMNGFVVQGCEKPTSQIHRFRVTAASFPVSLSLTPADLIKSEKTSDLIRVDPNGTASALFLPTPTVEDPITGAPLKKLPAFLEASSLNEALWDQLRTLLARKFSLWVSERLRGFVMVQSIADLMEDSPFWKDGPVLERGGLTIELDGPPLSKRKTLFSTAPFKQNSTYVSPAGIEIYANAKFLNDDDLTAIHGESFRSMGLDDLEAQSLHYLKNPVHWSAETFAKPQLRPSTAEMSLMIPTALINGALQTIYREGLLRFKTTIKLGKQTQGIITPEAPEVSTIIGISPLSAPNISFLARTPILEIRDYALDISTFIEDRLIPSSKILTNASISSGLVLDSTTQSVNLKLSPDTFRMRLQDLTGRMTKSQIDIFERLTNGLWRDFLSRYSSLVLFPSVIETQQIDLNIVAIDVQENAIILDVNTNWGEMSL